MKKLISFMLGTLMALSLAACGDSGKQSAQIPDPFTGYSTMEEAAQAAGFDLSAPDLIGSLEKTAIRVNKEGKLFEVIYGGDDEKIVIRKAEGSEDVSGDHTQYEQTDFVSIENNEVTMKGNDNKVHVATWTSGDYAYSITSNAGLSRGATTDLVSAVDSNTDDMEMIGGDPATWGA